MEPVNDAAPLLRGILEDLALNALAPLALYWASKRWISPSEFTALAVATTFPSGKAVWDFSRKRELDPITLLILLGIVASGVSLALGGSPRMLLIRESFVTGAFGAVCLLSLALPRPVMFYFGRYFLAGSDAARRARYTRTWQFPEVRRENRRITAVWGVVFLAELAARSWMAFHLPAATVLVLSPLLMAGLVVATLIWTFSRIAHLRPGVMAQLESTPPEIDAGAEARHQEKLRSA